MDFPMIFLFFFLSSFLQVNNTESYSTCISDCPATKCSEDSSSSSIINSPVIQFPFRIRSQRNYSSCGLPASSFEISCKQNKSFIHFESYGDLEVKSISYEEKSINLVDPNNCVHGVFLNLNLSDTPFRYYYVLKQYKYLNCSSPIFPMLPPFTRVPCLSCRGRHHVYIVESSLLSVVPDSCTVVKTVGIPFSYSPYISDNSFGLRFSWGSSDQKEGEEKRVVQSDESNGNLMRKRSWIDIVYYKVLGFAMFIFMIVTLAFLKTSYLDQINDEENEELNKKQNQMEAQALLEDCESTLRGCV